MHAMMNAKVELPRVPRHSLDIGNMEESQFCTWFRFHKADFWELHSLLSWPAVVIMEEGRGGHRWLSEQLLLLVLCRLRFP